MLDLVSLTAYAVCCVPFAGRLAARGGQESQALIQQGAPQGLLSMLQQSAGQDKVTICNHVSYVSLHQPPLLIDGLYRTAVPSEQDVLCRAEQTLALIQRVSERESTNVH